MTRTIKLTGTKFSLSADFELGANQTLQLANSVNVGTFGVVGNGIANDSVAMQAAATAAAGGRLVIPAGTYAIKAVVISANTHVECDRNAVFIPSDTSDATSANYIIGLAGDGITWTGGQILGQISTTHGVVPKPYYGLKVSQSDGDEHPADITIRDLTVTGCYQGIWAISSDGMTVNNVTVDRCYQWGMAFPAPRTKRLMVNGFRALNTGINEGLKIASLYQQTGDATADILLTNLHIEGCGGLHPTPSNWQNGIDLFTSAAQRVEISNFNLVNNYGGGLELKTNHAPDIDPNEYKNVRIHNGHVTTTQNNCAAISMNVTSPAPIAADTARQVSISDVQFDYVGAAAPSSANGIAMNAWTDVTIANCQFYGQFTRAINPSASGSFDSTLRRLFVSDCYVKGAANGFVVSSGVIETAVLTDNHFITTGECVYTLTAVTGSRLVVAGGTCETSGAATPAILVAGNVTDCLIRDVDVRATTYAVRANNGSGDVYRCRLASSTVEAMRVSGGAWVQRDNDLSVLTTKSAYIVTAGAITSYRNSRGSNTTTPTLYAQVGEVVYNAAPAAAGVMGWVCTTAGSPGTWKTFGTIES